MRLGRRLVSPLVDHLHLQHPSDRDTIGVPNIEHAIEHAKPRVFCDYLFGTLIQWNALSVPGDSLRCRPDVPGYAHGAWGSVGSLLGNNSRL